jgi:hypothetical protein
MKDKIITHKQKTSFLLGAFLRYGIATDSTKQVISIPNSQGKAGLCEEILKEFGCKNVVYTILKDYIPVGHKVSFEPSEEVGKRIQMAHHLLPSAFVYSQSEEDPDCTSNIENIFKVLDLKRKYETVDYMYEEGKKRSRFSKYWLNSCFEKIRGFPLYPKQQYDSIQGVNPGELVEVEWEWVSKEEMYSYLEQLNYTPQEVLKEYREFIQHIKSEKEFYLKCLDAELAKGDSSEYIVSTYTLLPPGMSVRSLPTSITKINLLKIFKEFIFNDNEEVLPGGIRVYAYLKCGCKIP